MRNARDAELMLMPHLRRGVGQLSDSAQIQSVLGGIPGVSQDQVNQAITTYNGLTSAATGSILGILNGGPINAATLGPVVASGMALLGATAPEIAAVSIGLSVLGAFASLFAPAPQNCSWRVANKCFNSNRPSGPGDPAWMTWGQFAQNPLDVAAAFPWYYVQACDLGAINSTPTPSPQLQFLKTYYAAWQANAEYLINGYQAIDDCALLTIVANAWNNGHDGSSTYTFQPTPAFGLQSEWDSSFPGGIPRAVQCPGDQNLPPFVPGAPPTARSYVGLLMDGDITATRCSAQGLPINTGGAFLTSHFILPPKGPSVPATTSTGAKVAIGGAAVVGAGLLGIGVLALIKGWGFGKAVDYVWGKTGKPAIAYVKKHV
jgi:hypothetical protein